MTDNGKSRFERAIEARIAVLGVSGARLAEAAGWSRTQFGRIKGQRDPKVSQIRRMALLLGVHDASMLLRDVGEIVSAQMPDPCWLDAIAALRDECGFAEYIGADDVWTLDGVIGRWLSSKGVA